MNPSLIIGLGGTGAWVLTHLKHLLLQKHEGTIPSVLHLLAFDVEEEPPILDRASVQLQQGQEYLFLRGDLHSLVHAVASGRYPHIGAWLPARHWLNILPPHIFHGGIPVERCIGRLALFHDLMSQDNSMVYRSLSNVMHQLRWQEGLDPLPVYIVSSTFGGTGSAQLVDMAHLVRQIARRHDLDVTLYAFLVAPEAFWKVTPDGWVFQERQARGFAAMREINRFQTAIDPEAGYPMYYHEKGDDPVWRGYVTGRLFNSMTYVDGQAFQYPLTSIRPDQGIAPAVAEMLDTLIHDLAVLGGWGAGRAALYRTFGCYTLELPMRYIVEMMACQLVKETLNILLAPEEWDENDVPVRLAPDRNREACFGAPGREAVLRFLTASQHSDHREPTSYIQGTLLLVEIAELSESYNVSAGVQLQAELVTRNRWEWQEVFCPPPHLIPEETVRILSTRLCDHCEADLQRPGCSLGLLVKPRQLKDTIEGYVHCAQYFIDRFLGQQSLQANQANGGEYQQALDACADEHVRRFARLLENQAMSILNGYSADPYDAKGGKLGYLQDFLRGLITALDKALEKYQRAWRIKDSELRDQEPRTLLRVKISAAHQTLYEMLQHKGFQLGLFSGRLVRTFRELTTALDKLVDQVCAHLVLRTVIDTVARMREEACALQYVIAKWENTDAHELYTGIQHHYHDVRDYLIDEERVAVRNVIRDQNYEEALYERYTRRSRDAVADILMEMTWQLTMDREQPELRLTLPGGATDPLSPTKVFEHCHDVFADTLSHESLIEYLMQTHPNPAGWAGQLMARSEPQLALAPGAGAPVQACYLLIAYDQDQSQEAYLDQVIAFLNANLGIPVELVRSEDRFTCSLVRKISDIPLEQTVAYQRGLCEYLAYSERNRDHDGWGCSILHIFPAEVNAARLEQGLPELGQTPRIFDECVTVLLEDIGLVRLFALAYVFDLVKCENDAGGAYFHLLLPPESSLPAQDVWLTNPGPAGGNLVTALHTFTYHGQDVRVGLSVKTIDHLRVEREIWRVRSHTGIMSIEKGVQRLEVEIEGLTGAKRDLTSVFALLLHDVIKYKKT
ncbi:MAG: hypothetical protein JXA42_22995 [Anaerolineales bacterium]|nr:hypothetical protein [Anaerolineales bacterium]